MSTEIELFWDRDRDVTGTFKFSGSYSTNIDGSSGNAVMQYPGQSIQLRLEQRNENIIALVKWDEDRQIRLDLSILNLESDNIIEVKGMLNTPFEGFERIVVEITQRPSKIQVSKLSLIYTTISIQLPNAVILVLLFENRNSSNISTIATTNNNILL